MGDGKDFPGDTVTNFEQDNYNHFYSSKMEMMASRFA